MLMIFQSLPASSAGEKSYYGVFLPIWKRRFWSEQEGKFHLQPPRPWVFSYSRMSAGQTQQNPSRVCLGAAHWWQTPSQDLDLPGSNTALGDHFPNCSLHNRGDAFTSCSPTSQSTEIRAAYLPPTVKTPRES